MMLKFFQGLTALSLLALAPAAFAGYDVGDNEYNFYAGVGAGTVSGFAKHGYDGDIVLGFQPHPAIALELDAKYITSVSEAVNGGASLSSGNASALGLSALVYCADAGGFNAFLRFGAADTKLSITDSSSTKVGAVFGAGLQYQFYHKAFMRLEYDRLSRVGDSTAKVATIDGLLGYRF